MAGLAIAVILLLAQLTLLALIYLAVQDTEPAENGAEEAPKGYFSDVDVMSPTTANVTFGLITGDPAPIKLKIILRTPTESGTYSIPGNEDGTVLSHDSGDDTGTITYYDYINNQRVNVGDHLLLTDLTPETTYVIFLVWISDHVMDAKSFTTTIESAPGGYFSSISATSNSTAEAIFGTFSRDVDPIYLKIILQSDTQSGTYYLPSNNDGTILVLQSGVGLASIIYLDPLDNGKVDLGDQLSLTGLEDGEHYVIFMVWIPTDGLIDSEVFSTPVTTPPSCAWGPVLPTSNTTAEAVFGGFSVDPAPVNLKIYLERDGVSGVYNFPNNDDDITLALESGTNVGTIVYRDFVDNKRVNTGDKLMMSGLSPTSEYTIIMIWGPTGDALDTENFFMPA